MTRGITTEVVGEGIDPSVVTVDCSVTDESRRTDRIAGGKRLSTSLSSSITIGANSNAYRYAFVSLAAALMKAAAAVPLGEMTTSLPTLYARTLSYFLKTLMVLMYRSRRLVVQAGEARSMEPFTGRDKSMLELELHVSQSFRCKS